MNTPISNLNPHYTNEYFKTARTIWGKEVKDIFYNYSDRLFQWDYAKHEEAFKTAKEEIGNTNTARFFQKYLSLYHDKPVQLNHILAGFNLSTGYPYRVYGYKFVESNGY